MSTEKQRPKIGVGIAVIKNGKVLLGKRMNAHGAGEWAFPGGHLEFCECPHDCVKRELLEETGLEALSITPGPWTNDIMESNKHYVTLFMFVQKFAGTPKVMEPHKCESWNWFEWSLLPTPLFLPIQTLIKNVGIESLKSSIEG